MAIPTPILRLGYTFLFMLALSRIYTLLITLGVIPEFPDPIVEFLAKGQEKIDEYLGGGKVGAGSGGNGQHSGNGPMSGLLGSVIGSTVGVLVFGAMMKMYAPNAAGLEGKKGGRGMGRQYLIVVGRIAQCVVFMGRECALDALWSSEGCGAGGEACSRGWPCVWRVVDLGLSAGVAALEISRVNWDGGLIDGVFGMVRGLVGGKEDESEINNENKEVEDGVENMIIKEKGPAGGKGKGKKGKKQR